jgi:hypothetical protein
MRRHERGLYFVLASIKQNIILNLLLLNFVYDAQHRITALITSEAIGPNYESNKYVFNFTNASDTIPYTYYTNPDLGPSLDDTSLHQLSYDSLNRIIKDTVIYDAVFYNLYVSTFGYSGDSTFFTCLLYGSSTFQNPPQGDTAILTNGNVTQFHCPYSYSSTQFFNFTLNQTFSNYPNPLYWKPLASTIGPLLYFIPLIYNYNAYNQYLSKNIIATTDGTTTNTNFTTDSKGRVTQYISGSDTTFFNYYYH